MDTEPSEPKVDDPRSEVAVQPLFVTCAAGKPAKDCP